MSGKYALIIGTTEYTDPKLPPLTAPGKDTEDLARILKDQDICAFDEVNILLNQSSSSVIEAIDEFFDEKKPDDMLVLYFSGHGIRDDLGSLYLAFKNTIRSRLRATAIKSDYIREAMDQSRSKRQVLILDCCNSGAFPQGTKAELGGSMGMTKAFQGYGRFVLTASDATQFAWEGDKVIGETDNSLFTHFLVKGLEGEADSDSDGRITVDELYDYTYDQISRVTPKQTPTKSSSKVEGEILLRQSTRIEDIKAVALPAELIDEIEDTRPYVREAAVQKLARILAGKNIGLARSARNALEKIAAEDDSRRVAQEALESITQVTRTEIPISESQPLDEKAEDYAAQKEKNNISANIKTEVPSRKTKEIFISYSRQDQKSVDHIVEKMERAGLKVWIDREDIKAGTLWRTQIVQAIDTCKAFVLMLSPHSVISENVRKEIDLAQDSGCNIFIVMLSQVQFPAEIRYQLAGIQHIDIQSLGLNNGSDKLIETLKEYLANLIPTVESPTQQVELVIQGIDLAAFGAKKQEQLLNFLSQMANARLSDLKVVRLASGSVHAFVNMPLDVAYRLKTFALNQDTRYKQFSINAIRLLGNKKFINTTFGTLATLESISHPRLSSEKKLNVASYLLITIAAFITLSAITLLILITNFLASNNSNIKNESQLPPPLTAKTLTPERTSESSKNNPVHTPTASPAPVAAVPTTFPLKLCTTSSEYICVYTYSPQPTSLIITFIFKEEKQTSDLPYLTVKGLKFKCEILTNYRNRLYCSGPSVTGDAKLIITSSTNQVIASGSFNIQGYVVPSPTSKIRPVGPYH